MKLFIVATPIGNLDDVSARAKQTLLDVDLIAAEDTRHSKTLMQHLGVSTPLVSYHDHNERDVSGDLIAKIEAGTSIALISDAGTPLISDPGYRLVQLAHARGVEVVAIPGPSALIAGLSISGLPTDRFLFVGFLPSKQEARKAALELLFHETATLVFYESRHRIDVSLAEMVRVFGGQRPATLARELTKRFEQVVHGTLDELYEKVADGSIVSKGEFVVMVGGSPEPALHYEHSELMRTLLAELPPRKAAGVASQLTGQPRKMFYELALTLKNR